MKTISGIRNQLAQELADSVFKVYQSAQLPSFATVDYDALAQAAYDNALKSGLSVKEAKLAFRSIKRGK